MARKNRQKAGKAGAKRSPVAIGLIVAAVVGVGVVGYAVSSDLGGGGGAMAVAPVEVEGLDDPIRGNELLLQLAEPLLLGDADAPVRIIEFADYQCPACRYFQESVKPRIQLAYVQDGLAQFVFYDFPLVNNHPHAFLAARAARCAGDQDRYWDYHDALFMNQPSWSMATSPARQFVDYAGGLGLDRGAFEACLRSDRHAEVVTANLRLGQELALPGTPSVLVQVGQGMWRQVDFNTLEEIFDRIVQAVEELQSQPGD